MIFKQNCSKHLWSSFLVLSAKHADLLFMIANPSSLYRPMFSLPNQFLDKINSNLRKILNLNQCKNTQNVIEWFGNIKEKHRHSFISFNIVDFYPSISENLLDQALSWASNLATITKDEISIIKHARKSLLFNDGKPWTKKDSNSLFDVTMGSYTMELKFVNL